MNNTTRYPVNELCIAMHDNGTFAGRPCGIVRLQGCDQGCPWCLHPATWRRGETPPANKIMRRTGEEIAAKLSLLAPPPDAPAVITGGEPCIHDLTELVHALKLQKFRVVLETAGHCRVPWETDWLIVSPKPAARWPRDDVVEKASEFVVVVTDEESIEEAVLSIRHRNLTAPVWLQPEWSLRKDKRVLELVMQAVMVHEGFRAGWQVQSTYDELVHRRRVGGK